MMNNIRIFAAIVLGLVISLAACAPAARPGARIYLQGGLSIGQLSGPGAEDLARALKSQATGGSKNQISGEVFFTNNVRDERETVPVTVVTGKAESVYKPDPFTSRLWLVDVVPTATEFQDFDFQRLTGEMVFDWRITDESGAKINSGRSAVDLNRTFGGFLAARKIAPQPASPARLAGEAGRLLAEEMTHALALDLGREPAPSEIESAPDEWSQEALLLANHGDWDGARALWLEALDLNPNFAPALYNLGLYYERRQDPKQALDFYQKAFTAKGSPLHRAALTRLTETLMRAGRLADQ